MATRNFWLEAHIDDKETPLASGPRAKDGGFTQRIYIRDNGGIRTAATIEGWANGEDLHLTINANGEEIRIDTKR